MGEQGCSPPDLSGFRERCSYCYKDIKDGISVCTCGLSFCNEHRTIHTDKAKCSISFEARKKCLDGNSDGECDCCKDKDPSELLEIRSEVFDDDQIAATKKSIGLIIKCQNKDERIILKDEEVDCPHINKINNENFIELGNIQELKCELCDIKTRVWVCFTCGHIGCGRVQYGVEGNGHAKLHHDQTKHDVFVLVQSLGDPAGTETFCYSCDSNIKNVFVHRRLKYLGVIEEQGDSKEKDLSRDVKMVSRPSPYVGIVNAGNTCYISSVLQMVGYVVSKQGFDVETHFQICWMENPLECFFCQLMRVFSKMKEASVQSKINKISIVDLVRVIWRDMPMFTKHVQHDAHEFLLFLLEKMQEGEEAYVIPPITSSFNFEVGRRISCGSCKDESTAYERMSMLCTIIKSRVRSSVAGFFNDDEWDCSCGGKKKATKFVTKLPEYLIVQVGRYSYGNDGFGKVNDKISMESLKLDKFMGKAEPEESMVGKLVDEGYPRDDVVAVLSLCHNDEEKARSIIQERISEAQRTSPKYRVVGCINHSGENVRTGHYTWWVYNEERCYLVDDTNVLDSNVEILEDGYIFLFR